VHSSVPSVDADLTARAAADLADALRRGNLSSVELTVTCLARIAELDPLISSVLAVPPDVVAAGPAKRLIPGWSGDHGCGGRCFVGRCGRSCP
jgi:hypothetical protein